MRPWLTLGIALMALAAGCGSSDEDEVTQTVDALYAGFSEKDANKVCGTLTAKQRERLTKAASSRRGKAQSCEQVMGLALTFVGDALKDADKAEVTEVEVKGSRAKATVEYKGKSGNLGLAKQGENWKVDDFDLAEL